MEQGNKFKLTEDSVRKRCLPPQPGDLNGRGKLVSQLFYWDIEIRGFAVIVRPPKGSPPRPNKVYVVQKDVLGKPVRVTLGNCADLHIRDARELARDAIALMRRGINPNRQKREQAARGVTLAQAMEMHKAAMVAKECSERSIADVDFKLGRHLRDWLDRELASITRDECAARHERITKGPGKYAANHALRLFRAVYNTASKRTEGLPPCPTVAVTFNKESRRREPIPWAELPAWREQVEALPNPVRRDLQLFILFTGLRATDAKTVRWDEVDLEAGTVHRPKPKGGVDRAFTVPVSSFVLGILRRRRAEARENAEWVFPARTSDGRWSHVQEPKEPKRGLPSPHRLRDTFATAAHEARVHPMDLKILLNHTLPSGGNVTEGYIAPSEGHLRDAAERVAAFLLERMGEGREVG